MRWRQVPGVAWALLVLAAGASAQAGDAEPRDDERCLVCERVLDEDGHVVLHRGRRVPLCARECADAFEADPELFFARLQPRAALFQEGPDGERTGPWFWVGVWAVAGLVSAAGCAYLAVSRGQPALGWFFAGLAGNVAALAVVAFLVPRGDVSTLPAGVPRGLGKVPTTRRPLACPECGRHNHPAATACPSCGHPLRARAPSEVARPAGGAR